MKKRTALAIVLALIVFVGVSVFVYFVEMSNTTRAVVWLVACVVILASQWIVLSGSKHLGGYFAMWTLAFVLIAIGCLSPEVDDDAHRDRLPRRFLFPKTTDPPRLRSLALARQRQRSGRFSRVCGRYAEDHKQLQQGVSQHSYLSSCRGIPSRWCGARRRQWWAAGSASPGLAR